MRCRAAVVLLCACLPAWAAYDANGVTLGTSEKALLERFPSAHCQPLQWKSRAADRRCDDARITFAGVFARITFYLKGGRVEAFDIAFDPRHVDTVARSLKERYGEPVGETREKLADSDRELYKVRWQSGGERAVLTAQPGRRRATLSVSRGDFEEEIYRVR